MEQTAAPSVILTPRYFDAAQYASQAHAQQTRKGKPTPYISHLLGASASVLEAGGDEDQAIAALLHDAVEDQGGQPRLDDIRVRYGDRIADIVFACSDSVTEDPQAKAPWRERKEHHLAKLRDADSDVVIVTIADKLHNARAIVADLQVEGMGTLTRFNTTDPADLLWYYRSMLEVLAERGAPAVLVASMSDAVDRMGELIDAA